MVISIVTSGPLAIRDALTATVCSAVACRSAAPCTPAATRATAPRIPAATRATAPHASAAIRSTAPRASADDPADSLFLFSLHINTGRIHLHQLCLVAVDVHTELAGLAALIDEQEHHILRSRAIKGHQLGVLRRQPVVHRQGQLIYLSLFRRQEFLIDLLYGPLGGPQLQVLQLKAPLTVQILDRVQDLPPVEHEQRDLWLLLFFSSGHRPCVRADVGDDQYHAQHERHQASAAIADLPTHTCSPFSCIVFIF